jgi:very-short-patch-repair endonuclease
MPVVHVDRRIAELAAGQDSLVTWSDLVALGLGRGAIEHRVKRGLLHRVHRGVYRWGVPSDEPWTRARAAVLACGDDSIATHHAALGLYGLRPHPAGPIDVTVVGRRVRREGVRVHSVASMHEADARRLRGIAVSSPARALLEVSPELSPRDLASAVEQAQVRKLVSKRDIAAAIARSRQRAGVPALRALLDEPAFTRSKAERLVVRLVRAARLPEPAFNAYAEGFEVDALWRRERVALEFDSYEFHATRAAFERDRRKTAALTRAQYVVLRTTWYELRREPYALVARTAEALVLSAARGAGGGLRTAAPTGPPTAPTAANPTG